MKRFMFARSMRSVPGSQIGLFIRGCDSSASRARRASNYKGSRCRSESYASRKKRNAGAWPAFLLLRVRCSGDQEIFFLLARSERGRIPARPLAAAGPGLARIGGIAVFRLDLAPRATATAHAAAED